MRPIIVLTTFQKKATLYFLIGFFGAMEGFRAHGLPYSDPDLWIFSFSAGIVTLQAKMSDGADKSSASSGADKSTP